MAKLVWVGLLIWVQVLGMGAAEARFFEPSERVAGLDSNDPRYVREWNRVTTIGDYQRVGHTNVLWDGPVLAALEDYIEVVALPLEVNFRPFMARIATNVSQAIELRCDDALVLYLYARFVLNETPGIRQAKFAEGYAVSAEAMEDTGYAPVRKTYANQNAARMMQGLTGGSTNFHARLRRFQLASVRHLNEMLQDRRVPAQEAIDLARRVWSVATHSVPAQEEFENVVLPTLQKNWSSNAFAYWIAGDLYIEKAWRERGFGLASTVTEQGAAGFLKNLQLAEKNLRAAWEIDGTDTSIPISMITVCLGMGYPRAEMERWFKRAMRNNPNSYSAALAKAYYLEPKWHGSFEEMIAFGRECVANRFWGGKVPPMLRDIHRTIREYEHVSEGRYNSRPEVWADIRASYERYMEANPTDVLIRHDYARDAFNAGKYHDFLTQVSGFTTGTNLNFFGGPKEFEAMVKKATDATSTGT